LKKIAEVFRENGYSAITAMAYVLNASTFHVIYLFAARMRRKLFEVQNSEKDKRDERPTSEQ
jgi:hypothetical protein